MMESLSDRGFSVGPGGTVGSRARPYPGIYIVVDTCTQRHGKEELANPGRIHGRMAYNNNNTQPQVGKHKLPGQDWDGRAR